MHPAIHRGDPAEHPGRRLFKEYGLADESKESAWSTGATSMTVQDGRAAPGTSPPFVWNRAATTPEMVAAAWERARAELPGADSGDQAYRAIRYMQQMVEAAEQAATTAVAGFTASGPAQLGRGPVPTIAADFGMNMTPSQPAANGHSAPASTAPPAHFIAATPGPADRSSPQVIMVPPPQIAVQFYLPGLTGPLTFFYHDVQRNGAWLYLILDDRYPGVSQFPGLDIQDDIISIVVDGHPTGYGCRAAANRLCYDNRTISNLLIDHEIPLER